MDEVQLSAGTIRYHDQGDGPVVVFVHGLLVNSALWKGVAERLSPRFRCIRPDWPLGAHPVAMNSGTKLTPRRVAQLIGEFLEALDLCDVTLAANDTGGALTQLLLADGCDRVGRVVLTPCDSFDNFLPPAFRPLQYLAKVPGALTVAMQPLRLPAARRAAVGLLAKHPVPADIVDGCVRPYLTDRGIRRDTIAFLRSIDANDTIRAAEQLQGYDRPVLLLWTRNNRFFPLSHAQRWTQILADARIVEIDDAYTFVPADQPEAVAREMTEFIISTDHLAC
jgi:pimeloyl-ACP methyl ester carboxylesterase